MMFEMPERGVPHIGVTIDAKLIGAECPAAALSATMVGAPSLCDFKHQFFYTEIVDIQF
jgi:hypothetical protein